MASIASTDRQSGDACPSCSRGRLACYGSKAVGGQQLRYLRCSDCGGKLRSMTPATRVRRQAARLVARLSRDAHQALRVYLADHSLSEGDALRIAIDRLLAEEPTAAERTAA